MSDATQSPLTPWNIANEATENRTPPSSVVVIDCTLREGEQTPGVVIRRDDKLRLAETLVEAGFRQLEVGMPAISAHEAETIRLITGRKLGCLCYTVTMATKDDILLAKECGADGIGLSLPSGRLQLEAKLGWSQDRVIDTAVSLTNFAHSQGLLVTLSPYDTFRADASFLERYLRTVKKDGHLDRLRIVDTVGCAAPHAVTALVRRMKHWTDGALPIEVHCHNDFGLAVANTIAGVMSGGEVVSTTVNGIGERAGGASTQQVVAALELLYGVGTGIDLQRLPALARLVETISGVPMSPYEPLVGSLTFQMESGSVISGFLKDPLVAFPFPPELIGARPTVILGKKSGRHAVLHKLSELGVTPLTDDAVARLLRRVKSHAEETGAAVPNEIFAEWVQAEAPMAESQPQT